MNKKYGIANVLEKAAQRLDKPNSWCRGALAVHNPDAPDGLSACAVGSISIVQKVGNYLDFPDRAYVTASAVGAVEKHLPLQCPLAVWNDHHVRSKEDLAELFRRIACTLKVEAEQEDLVTADVQ